VEEPNKYPISKPFAFSRLAALDGGVPPNIQSQSSKQSIALFPELLLRPLRTFA
jgi:hypothetical protein